MSEKQSEFAQYVAAATAITAAGPFIKAAGAVAGNDLVPASVVAGLVGYATSGVACELTHSPFLATATGAAVGAIAADLAVVEYAGLTNGEITNALGSSWMASLISICAGSGLVVAACSIRDWNRHKDSKQCDSQKRH